jgi:chemotaxis protein methyltransferase CheR
VDSLSTIAFELADQGDLEHALDKCEEWISKDKLNPASHCLRGMILYELGRFKDARLALERSMYVDPAFIMAHVGLGHVARSLGRKRDSERHFRNARMLVSAAAMDQKELATGGRIAARVERALSSSSMRGLAR